MRSPACSPKASSRGRPYDRHSGTGTLGLPKKKGAGGKGVWGAPMDQDGAAYIDKNDPNYDSDADAQAEADPAPPHIELAAPVKTVQAAPVSQSKD